ncbi:hypothetical protein FACS1894214_5300 [Planctomycetales bacterium]|nr:hypothetical protein FACS1894214_5300 [Planctomycetales bacterium]
MPKAELYRIFWDDIPGGSFAEDPRFLKENYYFMPYTGRINDWQTFHCHIVQGAGFEDYQANAHFRMCSQRLKDLFENSKGAEDKIDWATNVLLVRRVVARFATCGGVSESSTRWTGSQSGAHAANGWRSEERSLQFVLLRTST